MNFIHSRIWKRLMALELTIVVTIFVLILFIAPLTDNQKIIWLSWVGILMLVTSLGSWALIRRELLAPYPVLLVVAYVFMFGQCFLWAVGLEALPIDLRRMFNPEQIVLAQTFTLLGLGAYHIGALLGARGDDSQIHSIGCADISRDTGYLFAGVKAVGWLLFLVFLVPFAMERMRAMKVAKAYGYAMIYRDVVLTQTGIAGIRGAIAQYFTLSLIALLVGYRDSAIIRFICLGITILTILSNLYVGVRGPAFALVIVLILLWHYFVKPIRGKRLLVLVLLILLLLSLIPTVYTIRNKASRSLQDVVSVWGFHGAATIAAALGELGGSMFPLIKTMELVPSFFPFRYGASYAWAFTTLFPNLGFWEIHPACHNADLGYWLAEVLGLSYGPGYSWAAEAYINYGWFGIAVLFVMGFGYGWLFSLIDRVRLEHRPDLGVVVLIVLSLVMMTTRNSFIGTVRAFVYYTLPVYVGIHLVSDYLRVRALHRKKIFPGV